MEKQDKKLDHYHEIQQLFRYHYRNDWVSQSFINQHERLWVQSFNRLVKEGFIEKKKGVEGYRYRWSAKFPDI